MIREPIVAGQFYPSEKEELKNEIENYLNQVKVEKPNDLNETIAIIVPHAGYMYSGIVKAHSYYFLKFSKSKDFVIIGLDHYGIGFNISVYNKGYWKTPFGKVKVNEELANEIAKELNAETNLENFKYEHSIEVQLPFLQYLFKDFSIVPIMISNQNLENARKVANSLFKIYKRKKFVLIASSDLNHYEDYETTKFKDEMIIKEVLNLNEREFYSKILKFNISACGHACLATFIIFSKLLNAKVKLIKYMNSGDVSKDYFNCVGYASIISYL